MPRCGNDRAVGEDELAGGPFRGPGWRCRVFSGGPCLATQARYSCSLGLKLTLMGSTCETVVMTVWRLTRSPTWDLATPAMPSIGETTFVQPRSSFAFSRAARALSTLACAVRSRVSASSSSCWLMAFCGGQGPVARHRRLRVGERRLVLGERALGLVVRRLELPRVDLEEGLAGLDDEAFPVGLLEHVALDLRADLGVDVAVERCRSTPGRPGRPSGRPARPRRRAEGRRGFLLGAGRRGGQGDQRGG